MSSKGVPVPKRRFSEDEDKLIKKLYHSVGPTGLARQMNRNKASIRSRASKLGIVERYGPRKARYVHHSKPHETGSVLQHDPLPVSPALARLAQYDPLFAKVMREKLAGLPPATLTSDCDE